MTSYATVRTYDMAMADALVEAVARGFRSYDDFADYLDSLGSPWWEEDVPGCPICDGIHGSLCPIESPDPLYYEDEMRAGR